MPLCLCQELIWFCYFLISLSSKAKCLLDRLQQWFPLVLGPSNLEVPSLCNSIPHPLRRISPLLLRFQLNRVPQFPLYLERTAISESNKIAFKHDNTIKFFSKTVLYSSKIQEPNKNTSYLLQVLF